MSLRLRTRAIFLAALLMGACGADALADPPAHAPAHGWRKKHDPYYTGYTGERWERDYDISSGSCDRAAIGAVLGGVAGGIVGSKVAAPESRAVGIIVGTVAGALLGSKIGHELDEADRGCFGHALEIARPGARVTWINPATGVRYALMPGGGAKGGSRCREFTLEASAGGHETKRTGSACQTAPGVWKIA